VVAGAWIGRSSGRHIHSLNDVMEPARVEVDALLELADVPVPRVGLITHGGRMRPNQGAHFRSCPWTKRKILSMKSRTSWLFTSRKCFAW